jgi:hypothetical protein
MPPSNESSTLNSEMVQHKYYFLSHSRVSYFMQFGKYIADLVGFYNEFRTYSDASNISCSCCELCITLGGYSELLLRCRGDNRWPELKDMEFADGWTKDIYVLSDSIITAERFFSMAETAVKRLTTLEGGINKQLDALERCIDDMTIEQGTPNCGRRFRCSNMFSNP